MVTVSLGVFGSGESHVKGEVAVTGKFRYTTPTIQNEVDAALTELYSPTSTKINQPVRVSDVIAAIDNVPSVDYVDLTSFYVEPFMRTQEVDVAITYSIIVNPSSLANANWDATVSNDSPGFEAFSIRKEGFAIGTVLVGGPAVPLGDITIQIATSFQLAIGDVWTFTVGPYNSNVELTDLTIPVILPGDMQLSITETYIQS